MCPGFFAVSEGDALFQQDQPDAVDSVENTRDHVDLGVAHSGIERAGARISGVGIHAKERTAIGAGIFFVEGHELFAVTAAGQGGRDDQSVEHHDLFRIGGILPGRALIDIHLELIDYGCADEFALVLAHEQVIPLQCGPGGVDGGINPANPADRDPVGLLFGVDIFIDPGDGGEIGFNRFSKLHRGHLFQ